MSTSSTVSNRETPQNPVARAEQIQVLTSMRDFVIKLLVDYYQNFKLAALVKLFLLPQQLIGK